jgi:hypothetical protein
MDKPVFVVPAGMSEYAVMMLGRIAKIVVMNELLLPEDEIGSVEQVTIVIDSYLGPELFPELEPCQGGEEFYKEPLPRPPKTKLRIQQAPRQSFRQSMRSVNRNR